MPRGMASGHRAEANAENAIAEGETAIANGEYSVAKGFAARAQGRFSQIRGYRAKDGSKAGASSIVQGREASTVSTDPATLAENGDNIAFGDFSFAGAWRAIAFGRDAIASAISATAFGVKARAEFTHSAAYGRGAFTVCIGSVALGTCGGVFFLHVNNSHTSRYMEDGAVVERDPLLCETVFEVGMSGYDGTPTPIPDRPGGDFSLVGGISTGTAQGGALRLQVTPPAAESGTAKNPRVDALVAHPTRDVEVFSGVIISSPDGSRFRLTVDNAGDWHKELLSAPEPTP